MWGALGRDVAGGKAQERGRQRSRVQSVGQMGKAGAGRGRGGGAMEKRAKVCGGVPPSVSWPLPASSAGELCQDRSGWKRQPGSPTLSSLPLFGQFGT